AGGVGRALRLAARALLLADELVQPPRHAQEQPEREQERDASRDPEEDPPLRERRALLAVRALDHGARVLDQRSGCGAEMVEVALAEQDPLLRAPLPGRAAPDERDLLTEVRLERADLLAHPPQVGRDARVERAVLRDQRELDARVLPALPVGSERLRVARDHVAADAGL